MKRITNFIQKEVLIIIHNNTLYQISVLTLVDKPEQYYKKFILTDHNCI